MKPPRAELILGADRHAYVVSLCMIGGVTALGLATAPLLALRPSNIDIVYLLAVLISALKWGRAPAIFAAIVSAIVFDFCFIPPQFTFGFTDLPYGINLCGYLVVAIATSTLAARSRELMIERIARAQAEGQVHAKDAILGRISHELRSPLSAIVGWSQAVGRTNMDAATLSRAMASIENSARLLGRLIDDLLSASRITTGQFSVDLRPAKLAPIVSKAVEAAAPWTGTHDVRLESTIESVGEVLVDPQRIEQIVSNLLSNGMKFTPSGGRVSVSLTRIGKQAQLIVSDTGIGISKEFLPHVFEQFSQAETEQKKHGLGLGLSIVRYLVTAHGGSIAATSAGSGTGTTFTVRLPVLSPLASDEE